jgi:hypothetical protein
MLENLYLQVFNSQGLLSAQGLPAMT